VESHWRDRHSDKAPGRSRGGSWFDCRQGQEIFILSIASVPAVEPAQPDVRWERGCFPRGQNTRGVKLTTFNLVPSLGMMGAAPSGHHTPSYHEEGQIYLLRIPLAHWMTVRCPESIRPFWISREPVAWPWCNLAASQRRHYCASVNNHSPVGLVVWQWEAVDWDCALCNRRSQNDRASRSASLRQCACPLYSSRACFFWQSITSPVSVSPPTAHIWLPATSVFSRSLNRRWKEEICECHDTLYTRSVSGVSLPTD
jgi:hypothetical protein